MDSLPTVVLFRIFGLLEKKAYCSLACANQRLCLAGRESCLYDEITVTLESLEDVQNVQRFLRPWIQQFHVDALGMNDFTVLFASSSLLLSFCELFGDRLVAFSGLDWHEDDPLEKIPPSIRRLEMSYSFFDLIPVGLLPAGLEEMDLGYAFDCPLEPGVFPAGLKKLYLCKLFNQPIEQGVLPSGLELLSFGSDYKEYIPDGVFPHGLQSLTFSLLFNQSLGSSFLPRGLKSLSFGSLFNQPIDVDVLPPTLTTLSFGYMFDQPIVKGVLPASLENFILRFAFQPLTSVKLEIHQTFWKNSRTDHAIFKIAVHGQIPQTLRQHSSSELHPIGALGQRQRP